MTDFLRLLVEVAAYLWPFRLVHQWERGCYYVGGRYWRTVGPGVYPVLPYFTDVKELSVVYQEIDLPLQSVAVQSGDILTFSANVGITIADAGLAFNAIDDYQNTVRKSCAGHLADQLATVAERRLDVAARGRLLASLRTTLNTELGKYGITVERIRFTDFAPNARVYRVFNDQTMMTL